MIRAEWDGCTAALRTSFAICDQWRTAVRRCGRVECADAATQAHIAELLSAARAAQARSRDIWERRLGRKDWLQLRYALRDQWETRHANR